MIQRIQSVYLLIAALLLLAIPFTSGIVTPDTWTWHVPVKMALSPVAAVVSLAAIFLYADRNRQRSVVLIGVFLCLALLAYLLITAALLKELSLPSLWPLLLPLAALTLLVLARRAIKKDIELVRSMDRLR